MSTIRNLSFLAFFLAVVWAAPLRASTSALECVVDYYDLVERIFALKPPVTSLRTPVLRPTRSSAQTRG